MMFSVGRGIVFVLLGLSLMGCVADSGSAPVKLPITASERCENLQLSRYMPHASLETVRMVPADETTGAPPMCEIAGRISPNEASTIGVVYRFPVIWNHKIVGLGGGGFAGNVRLDAALPALIKGYATMQTDTGHAAAEPWNTVWAVEEDGTPNVEGLIDFGYRAVHEMTVLGKDLAMAYYGQLPARSYFQGCSQGGRQGMVAAQKYPQDFDGIIAGAPAFNDVARVSMSLISRAFLAENAKLSVSQIQLVNRAALGACDGEDGLVDGIVSFPDACSWNPQELLCAPGTSGDECLLPAQVAAVQSAYSDKRNADGKIVAYGLARGSELSSFPWFMALDQDSQLETGYYNFASAAGFPPDVDFRTNDVIASHEAQKDSLFDRIYTADNPDLSEFVKGERKLLLWHGWYDQLLPPEPLIDYYQEALEVSDQRLLANSSPRKSEESVQLFTAIGVSHCLGGAGPSTFDGLAVIDAWVESGEKPTRIVATQPPPAMAAHARALLGELPRLTPDTMTRPLCPWPQLPQYDGEGRPETAESFVCR
jgi:feruloyl esterase